MHYFIHLTLAAFVIYHVEARSEYNTGAPHKGSDRAGASHALTGVCIPGSFQTQSKQRGIVDPMLSIWGQQLIVNEDTDQ